MLICTEHKFYRTHKNCSTEQSSKYLFWHFGGQNRPSGDWNINFWTYMKSEPPNQYTVRIWRSYVETQLILQSMISQKPLSVAYTMRIWETKLKRKHLRCLRLWFPWRIPNTTPYVSYRWPAFCFICALLET